VSNFDDQVKRIVEHLEASGLGSNTIVVIYSDHGMELFEHDTWGQGNSVRGDFSARIPLIIVGPGVEAQTACAEIVRSIDIAPTLLELVGLTSPEAVDGTSLLPYLRGERASLNLAAFHETGIWLADVPGMPCNHLRYPYLFELLEVPDKRTGTLAIKPEFRRPVIVAKDRMVRVGPWKLTYQPTTDGPLYALFDVETDPECRVDLAAERADVVQQLRARLAQWMDRETEPRSEPQRETTSSVVKPQSG
jgi:arylsulfatase A-like enzyme